MPTQPALPAHDIDGRRIAVGDRVRILSIPHWLIHDLPVADQTRLTSYEGQVVTVLEFDQFGYVWFAPPESGFCLKSTDVRYL